MNKEGYKDPTAEQAVHKASVLPKHVTEVLQLIKQFAHITGFQITSITLEDTKTKKRHTWRR